MAAGVSLTWQVVYSLRGTTALKLVRGKASAIDAACEILDAGGDVDRIESADAFDSLNADQLRRIWVDRKGDGHA